MRRIEQGLAHLSGLCDAVCYRLGAVDVLVKSYRLH